jgi:V/A-type H+-transporting ATPase subunit I
MLRPRPARWFEVLAARDDATRVLEALARTAAVELEARHASALPAAWRDVAPLLAQVQELAARHRAYWPAPQDCPPSAFPDPPAASLQRSLTVIRAWASDAEPLILALQAAAAERRELQVWQPVLAALATRAEAATAAAPPIDPAALATAGPWLGVRLFVLPHGVAPESALPVGAGEFDVLASVVQIDHAAHLLVAGRPAALQAMAQTVTALKGRTHVVPAWLHADAAANEAYVASRLLALDAEEAQLGARLTALHAQHGLHGALGDANRLQWLLQNVHALESGELLCWITGWTIDPQGAQLAQALQASGARALLHFAPPPPDAHAPLLLQNPAWARPFELFSRALGMPAASEADPSQLLAIAVPLMFGYMFGDVGQGLLLAAGAWWLRDRSPVARLLLAGGLSAAVFGLLFGSVFGLHGLLPALWLHPLDAPLPVLLAPLLGGGVLLTLGLGLDALSAWWRGELRRWLLTDLALLVVYLALLAAFVQPRAPQVAAVAAVAFCIGHAVQARRLSAALGAIGELVERTLQILINTLSFARVGAFALAHAGLSSAIVSLMDAADSVFVQAVVLVLGNAVVIVLEAMVVSIQTTRLVLFEFFTRFMQGTGRAFRPLPAPPFTVQEN